MAVRLRSVKLTLPLVEANIAVRFRRNLRRHIYHLWSGKIDRLKFTRQMIDTIHDGLRHAFRLGLLDVGIRAHEMTAEEKTKLGHVITSQYDAIRGLADFILEREKGKGKLAQVLVRLPIWVNAFHSVRNMARMSAEGDPKMKWVLDPAKEHCPSCLKLKNKVKRLSYWKKVGVLPRNYPNDKLACGGWQCGCELKPTDASLTRGRLPALP
jgi:hypothetical protein